MTTGIGPTTQLDYSPAPGYFDELFEAPGTPRPAAAALTSVLAQFGRERLRSAAERRDAIFVQQGITFDASGPDGGLTRDRPFPLDLIPRILPAASTSPASTSGSRSPRRRRSPPRRRRSRRPAAGERPARRTTRPPAASSCSRPATSPRTAPSTT